MLRARFFSTFFALVILTLSHAPASANEILTPRSLAEIEQVLKGFGDVQIKSDDDGELFIDGFVDGRYFAVDFYDCTFDNSACDTMVFYDIFDKSDKATDELINNWNARAVFTKAFLSDGLEANLEMAVSLKGGITTENLEELTGIWLRLSREFEALLK